MNSRRTGLRSILFCPSCSSRESLLASGVVLPLLGEKERDRNLRRIDVRFILFCSSCSCPSYWCWLPVLILPLLGEKGRDMNSRRIAVCSIIFSLRVIGFLPRKLLLPSGVVLALRITFFWPVESPSLQFRSFSFALLTFVRAIALQRKGRAFSYMRDLIAVLNTVALWLKTVGIYPVPFRPDFYI